uniref:Uncharacterized protein n=1 Tax=viral metagenome TaxID=1070528 RepID=A0A6C0K3L9_9ZZZZ
MPRLFIFTTAIVVGLVASYLGTLHCHLNITKLTDSLNPSQLMVYRNARRRRLIYFIVGIILAIIGMILFLCLSSSPLYPRIINALIILLLTPMIVYTLFPKSPYMLEQTDINNQETKHWFSVYVCMKNGMVYGFCVGFIVALLVLTVAQLLIGRS